MPRRARTSTIQPVTVRVSGFDPFSGKVLSRSFTVYPAGADADRVAAVLNISARLRWRVTDVSDRRHKRR